MTPQQVTLSRENRMRSQMQGIGGVGKVFPISLLHIPFQILGIDYHIPFS